MNKRIRQKHYLLITSLLVNLQIFAVKQVPLSSVRKNHYPTVKSIKYTTNQQKDKSGIAAHKLAYKYVEQLRNNSKL